MKYQLRKQANPSSKPFAQLVYVFDETERIAANFLDCTDAVTLYQGNTNYKTIFRIIKYLGERGFDLDSADKTG